MKDIIDNRARIGTSTKLRLLERSFKENGFVWTFLMGCYYLASAVADKSYALADARRRARNLPGMNSANMNKLIWNEWDWSAKGEEWTPSPAWKQSVIDTLLVPNIPRGGNVVEIGPGGGRWTEALQMRAGKLTGIDISEACVEQCRKRFAHCDNVEFRVGSGTDLAGIANNSVDAIWSFDVFVHINKPQFEAYTREFARVLKSGGTGAIQHGSVGGRLGGWRSDVTTDDVGGFLRSAGLVVAEQVSTWNDGGHEHKAGLYDDVVTVFRKPQ
jgi:SAM-dependent methyltransferase